MKILLINPDTPKTAGRDLYCGDILTALVHFQPFNRLCFGFPLSLTTLAAVTPAEHEVKIVDEAVESIDFDQECDVVGLTAMTFKANRAYEIAKEFRRRGKKVLLGGIHATMCPEEGLEHVDCVVQGEAETIWPKILEDFQNGNMQRRYISKEYTDLKSLPIPRYDLLDLKKYYLIYIQTTRGCPYDCEFCTVTQMSGRKMRMKTPGQVITEIDHILKILPYPPLPVTDRKDGLKKKYRTTFFFTDDNFAIRKDHAMAVCKEIIRYQNENNMFFTWLTQVNYHAGLDDELLATMAEAGCEALFMGFESLDVESLEMMNKKMNSPELYSTVIQNVRNHGMECVFSTIIGTDFDTPQTADKIADFVEENDLFYVLPNILTPYPGTRLRKTYDQNGRVIIHDNDRYNIRNVVYHPGKMSPLELQSAYTHLCQRLFSTETLLPRSERALKNVHEKYRWVMDKKTRFVCIIMFLYVFTLLCCQGKLALKEFGRVFDYLWRNLWRHGTLLDFAFLAWALDNDAFARSEYSRLNTIKQELEQVSVNPKTV